MIKMIVRKRELKGEITAPPSKSFTHRAIICASLANGISAILNPLLSEDIFATINACKALGAEVLECNEERIVIKGNAGKIIAKENSIDFNESGSTMRFMIPLAALADKEIVFTGKEGLRKRPIADLLNALGQIGVKSVFVNADEKLPVRFFGDGKISGGKIVIRGDVSSQFVSGLLFALPLAESDSEIELTTELESKDYVLMTLAVLKKFGINVERSADLKKYGIVGKQKYAACDYAIEGDFSSAAFFLAGGALNGNIVVKNLKADSKQGDKQIIEILKAMNAKIEIKENEVKIQKSDLKAIEVDAKNIPDLVPIVCVLAAQANGATTIRNVERLKLKESNRLLGTESLIKKLGGKIRIGENVIEVSGKTNLIGNEVETLNDHRFVMSACIAGTIAEGETIVGNPIAVKKSYPSFFDDFRKLGADAMTLSNSFGNNLKMRIIGESHGKRIGVTLEGVPKGIEITQEFIQDELEKRKSTSSLSTPRKEEDKVKIASGIVDGKTNGEIIRMEIENIDAKSEHYEKIKYLPRPGHADYTARTKYASVFDHRGGGFLSGRMTACFVMAGAVAKQILEKINAKVLAHVVQIDGIKVERELSNEEIEKNSYLNLVRCADLEKAIEMQKAIEKIKSEGDSLGGIIECRVLNLPIGIGEPVFYSIESVIAQAMFSIPAVKGIEFGAGFKAACMKGSEHNDSIKIENKKIVTATNNAGGILGGISNGMPVVFRVVVKPTPSIVKEQETINIRKMQPEKIRVNGRHDPCISIRAPIVVEAMTAFAIADLLLRGDFFE